MEQRAGRTAMLDATERWFIKRGLPHFIAAYSASRDVFTRAVPTLALVFIVELGGALEEDWRWWQNILAAIGGLALLLGVWAVVNRLRGRPALALPERVGPVELIVFVLAPALVPMVFGRQFTQALFVASFNAALLGVVYIVTSYGLVPLTRWATGRMFHELGAVFDLFVRALPLLLLFVTFLFVNTEVWQVSAALEAPFFIASIALFVAMGGVFLATRLPAEVDRVGRFDSVDEVADLTAGTPVAGWAHEMTAGDLHPPPLATRQRGNVALVIVVSEAIQVTLVAALITTFFIVFGLIAIRPPVIESWLGHGGDVLAEMTVFGKPVVLTAELLRVAAFLGVFSGFYFTVYVITDQRYREEFFDTVLAEVRQSLAVRAVYLAAVDPDSEPRSTVAATSPLP